MEGILLFIVRLLRVVDEELSLEPILMPLMVDVGVEQVHLKLLTIQMKQTRQFLLVGLDIIPMVDMVGLVAVTRMAAAVVVQQVMAETREKRLR
jgi:hypothetical protein